MPQRFTFWYNAMGFLSTWELSRENYVTKGREKQVKFIERAHFAKMIQDISLYSFTFNLSDGSV